jgi:S1-C subfamily serine protease
MRKLGLYSSSKKTTKETVAADASAPPPTGLRTRLSSIRKISLLDPRLLWLAIAILFLLLLASVSLSLRTNSPPLTQKIIDSAVLKTLESVDLPSPAAKAYETILPSVVEVRSFVKSVEGDNDVQHGIGSGVVIVDKGIILTNLHVVQGGQSIKVVFSDGLEATATVISTQPENDLAVLQAHKMPDDLIAATMRSTADLRPGDQVLAVGFPFGIGPSASAGVVSGLKRTFRSPEGDNKDINNLIQFDAAANPGNSGGPLVTMDGQVVGIVTAILNPSKQRTFIGIGFAVPIEKAAQAAGMPPF